MSELERVIAKERIDELEQQLAAKDAEIARYKDSPTMETLRKMIENQAVKENESLHKQLAEREKQNVMLRETLTEYARIEECEAFFCSAAHKALDATPDLAGLIVCDAEPVAYRYELKAGEYAFAEKQYHSEQYAARKTPLYKAKEKS